MLEFCTKVIAFHLNSVFVFHPRMSVLLFISGYTIELNKAQLKFQQKFYSPVFISSFIKRVYCCHRRKRYTFKVTFRMSEENQENTIEFHEWHAQCKVFLFYFCFCFFFSIEEYQSPTSCHRFKLKAAWHPINILNKKVMLK